MELQPILQEEIYVIRVGILNPASGIVSGQLPSVVVTMSKKMVDDVFNSRMVFFAAVTLEVNYVP